LLYENEIYLIRRVITRYSRRGGKLWIRVFPDKSVTFRAAETRMGSGKGNVEFWVAVVKPGKVLYEVSGISSNIIKSALKTAAYKMPIKTRILNR
jgi:large subunit ribosomal protein L16